jgi:hypothetical protein
VKTAHRLAVVALLLPALASAQAAGSAAPAPAARAPAPADPWAPLRPLLGEWAGEPAGRAVEPISSVFTFDLQLGDTLLVRRHRAQMPPLDGQATGVVHEDLLVTWPEGRAWRATYWDNEGHVIQYRVTAGAAGIAFESEPGPGPRFRLEYRPRADGGQAITFLVAPPGGELKVYLSGGAHRRVP